MEIIPTYTLSPMSKKVINGFQLSFASNNKYFLLDTCTLRYGGTAIISAECEPGIVMEVLPFNKCGKLHDPILEKAFWQEGPLWLSDATAALMASYLDSIGRFESWSPFQQEIARSWKSWDFKTKADYGANLIQRKLGANCPMSLSQFQKDLSRQYDEINNRVIKTWQRFADRPDDEDEIPF